MEINKELLSKLIEEGLSQQKIAEVIGRTREYVKFLLDKHQLKTKRSKGSSGFNDDLQKNIINLYQEGQTLADISKKLKVDRATVKRRLLSAGVQLRKKVAHPNLRHDFFEIIDSEEKAYWLGFLYADGYVNEKNGAIVMDLAQKDEDQIKRFCQALGANEDKIRHRIHKCGSKSCSVKISSRQMCNDVVNLGCGQNKSLTVRFPMFIEKKLRLPFFSGYYDGDGYESSYEICCGSKRFLEDIKNIFSIPFFIRKKRTVYTLSLGKEFKATLESSYLDSMNRKRRVEILSNPSESLVLYRASIKKEIDKSRRKAVRPPYKQLLKEIEEFGYSGTGRKYGVSDNAIRKWVQWYIKYKN